jgi:hypothetical protein
MNLNASEEESGIPSDSGEVVLRIQQLLTGTLDNSKPHLELLTQPSATSVYRTWLCEHAIDLALHFASDSRSAHSGLELLQQLCSDAGSVCSLLAVIRSLLAGQPITQMDRAILLRTSPAVRSRFGILLETVWTEAESRFIDRDALLDWCTALTGHEYSNPALRLALGEMIAPPEIAALAKESARLPRRLWPKLSEAGLHAFREVHAKIREDAALWVPLISLWPRELTLTLLGAEFQGISRLAGLNEMQLTRPFNARAELIQDCVEEWLRNQEPDKVRLLLEVAPVLWGWITELPEPEGSAFLAVDICWCLARRRFIKDAALSQTPFDETGLAITLARLSGRYQELARDAQLLWRSAVKGWQIKLLLELFPLLDFAPLPGQLAALVPFRNWLRSHLCKKDIAARRRTAFKVATSEFHQIVFPGRDDEVWRGEWSDTVLGAAYRGTSAPRPRLRDVLEVYASTPAERGKVCLKSLSDAEDDEEFSQTLSSVLSDFLFPAAMDARLNADQFVKIMRAMAVPGSKRDIRVVTNSGGKPFERSTAGGFHVADYMVPLFWAIANRGYSSAVQKSIEKNYPALALKF